MQQRGMQQVHMSDSAIASDFAAALEKVRQGLEIAVEHNQTAVAILKSAEPPRRTIAEILALMGTGQTASLDEDFARDVAAAVESHRERVTKSQP